MGLATAYFYSSNDSAKQTLHRRIIPTNEQVDEQRDRWNQLAEHLRQYLSDAAGVPVTTLLQGSYKFQTQVSPVTSGGEYDIDLGVYFHWEGSPEGGEYSPKELKSFVQDGLFDFASGKLDIKEVVDPAKERCSRIRYAGAFHIDLPTYHLDQDRDARSLATESDIWEDSDPKKIYVWFKNSFDSDIARGKARRVIQYLKSWVALTFAEKKGPSSILLTVLVTEAFLLLDSDQVASDDDTFYKTLEGIVKRLSQSDEVVNPVNEEEVLSQRMAPEDFANFKRKLDVIYEQAEDAIQSETVIEAWFHWNLIFRHLFPCLDEPEYAKNSSALPAVASIPEIDVVAQSRRNPSFSWKGRNEIGPITKDCDIKFRVVNPIEFPANVEFYWMVRNEGEEAEQVFDLGHGAGTGIEREEQSAYRGTHYMECLAMQLSRIIGYRRVPVKILGHATPQRNPKKRPSYRNFAKKKR